MFRVLVAGLLFASAIATEVPVVGILSQEVTDDNFEKTYIAACYVKFVESSGARVVPVWIGQNQTYYEKVVNYTNGILFPGGDSSLTNVGGYREAAKILYDLAIAANDRGIYYPVWGACLGLEAIMYFHSDKDITVPCQMQYTALSLDFTDGYNSSKLFPQASEITDILQTQKVTFNNHDRCLTQEGLNQNNIEEWRVLTTNKDAKANITFVSTMEHTKYPFYAVQFHPEKNVFEFLEGFGIPHTEEAVKIAHYFANFLGRECRKNNNAFPEKDLEDDSLIYNYIATYTGVMASAYFEQQYIFEKGDVNSSPLVV